MAKGKIDCAIYSTDDYIVQALMIDYGKSEQQAMDIYYTSNTYIQFTDESNELYKKQWQKIYDMLKNELKI